MLSPCALLGSLLRTEAPWLYFVRAAPFSALFPCCACVVHHGGAGTFATALRAGTPSVIVPILRWYDQDGWAATAEGLGVGVACHGDPANQQEEEGDNWGAEGHGGGGDADEGANVPGADFPVPGVAQLRAAVDIVTTSACRERAAALAETERLEDGAAAAAALLTGCLCARLREAGESEACVAELSRHCVPCRLQRRKRAQAVLREHLLLSQEKEAWEKSARNVPRDLPAPLEHASDGDSPVPGTFSDGDG